MSARGAALQIAGRAGVFSMERPGDAVHAARLVRPVLKDPTNWKGSTRTGGRDAKILDAVRRRVPAALDHFPEWQLLAIAKRPHPPLCQWDSLRAMAALVGEQEPRVTAPLRELAGPPCAGCRNRQAIAEAKRKAAARAEAAAGARFAIAAIEKADGKLAGKIAELAVRHGWPPGITAEAIKAAASPVRFPGIFAPTLRVHSPPAGHQRPGIGLRRKTREPSYYRKVRPV